MRLGLGLTEALFITNHLRVSLENDMRRCCESSKHVERFPRSPLPVSISRWVLCQLSHGVTNVMEGIFFQVEGVVALASIVSTPAQERHIRSLAAGMATAQAPFSVNQNWQQVETAADWISCRLPGLRRPFRGVRRVMVVPCLRRPASRCRGTWRPLAFSTELSCMAHPREGIFRAGRQT